MDGNGILICRFGNRRKKKKIIHPICSVVAVFKMLIRIWDVLFFLFSGYSKSTVGQRGMYQKDMTFREIKFEGVNIQIVVYT